MVSNNTNHHEVYREKLEKKVHTREKKRRPKMKVSGKNVLKLKKIIQKRNPWPKLFCLISYNLTQADST